MSYRSYNAFDSFAKGLQVGQDFFHDKPQQRAIRKQAMEQQQTLFDQQQEDRANLRGAVDNAWDALANNPTITTDPGRRTLVELAHKVMTTEDPEEARTGTLDLLNSNYWSDWRKEHGITGKVTNGGFAEDGKVWLLYDQPDGKPMGFIVDAETFEADLMREASRLGDPAAFEQLAQGEAPKPEGGETVGLAAGDTSDPTLVNRESGGRWDAQNDAMGHGGQRGHFGRVQFGHARLQDAKDAGILPPDMTPEQFMASPELQQKAEAWHFGDIQDFIQRHGLDQYVGTMINGVPVTDQGLVNVAHLGGKNGLGRFLRTGGEYNPSDGPDGTGTRLSDYLRMGAESTPRAPSATEQLETVKAKEEQSMLMARREQREGLRAGMEQLEAGVAAQAQTVERLQRGLAETFEAGAGSGGPPTAERAVEYSTALRNLNQARAGLRELTEQQSAAQQQLEQMDAEDDERHMQETAEEREGLEAAAAAEEEARVEQEEGTPRGFAGRLGELFSPKRIMERAERRGGTLYNDSEQTTSAMEPREDTLDTFQTPEWYEDLRAGQGRPLPERGAAPAEAPSPEPQPEAPSAPPAGLGAAPEAPRARSLQQNPQLVNRMVERLRAAQEPTGLAGGGPFAGRSAAVNERERKAIAELAFQGKITMQQFENYVRSGSFNAGESGKMQNIGDGIVYIEGQGFIDVHAMMGRRPKTPGTDLRTANDALRVENEVWDSIYHTWGIPEKLRDSGQTARFRHDFNVFASVMGFEPMDFILGNEAKGMDKAGSQAQLHAIYRNHQFIVNETGSDWYRPWSYFRNPRVQSMTAAYISTMHGYADNPKEGFKRVRQDYFDPLHNEYKNWAAKDERNREMSEDQTTAYSMAISTMVNRDKVPLEEAREAVFEMGRASGWDPDKAWALIGRDDG